MARNGECSSSKHGPLNRRRDRRDLRETIVLEALLERGDRREGASLIGRVTRSMAPWRDLSADSPLKNRVRGTTFRRERGKSGELSVEPVSELLARKPRTRCWAHSVELSPTSGSWWVIRSPHWGSRRAKVYAYEYAHLLALSYMPGYEEEGERFVPRYLEL